MLIEPSRYFRHVLLAGSDTGIIDSHRIIAREREESDERKQPDKDEAKWLESVYQIADEDSERRYHHDAITHIEPGIAFNFRQKQN